MTTTMDPRTIPTVTLQAETQRARDGPQPAKPMFRMRLGKRHVEAQVLRRLRSLRDLCKQDLGKVHQRIKERIPVDFPANWSRSRLATAWLGKPRGDPGSNFSSFAPDDGLDRKAFLVLNLRREHQHGRSRKAW